MINSSTKADLAAHDHDQRLDFARGIANWFIFLDHIPNNVVNLLTMRNFGFSGAAELFVFATGYVAAVVYGRMTLERGFVVTSTRIFKRVWQLYAAYVVLFVVYISTVGNVAAQYAAADLIDEYNIAGIVDQPDRILMHGLTLQSQLPHLDALQLFIALMAFFPLALASLMRWPNLTLMGSFALYLAARTFDWSLSSFPDGRWFFNPFCWQLLFVLGAWFALGGTRRMRSIHHWPMLRGAALAFLLFAMLVTFAAQVPWLGKIVPDFLLDPFTPNGRENLAPYRVLHFMLLAFLFARLVPADWPGFRWKLLQPIVKCGEETLPAFCAGVFLAFFGHFILITGPNSLAMQVLVSVAGIAAMTAVAYYVSWSKRQDNKSALAARA
jgi:hypothetical protein